MIRKRHPFVLLVPAAVIGAMVLTFPVGVSGQSEAANASIGTESGMAQEIDGSCQTLRAAMADGSEPARSAASFGLPTTILVPAETKIVTTTCTEVVPISSDSQPAILAVAAGDEAGHSWLLLTVTATTDEEASDINWTEALAGNGFRVDQLRDTPYGATNAPEGVIGSEKLIPLWDVITASWQTG